MTLRDHARWLKYTMRDALRMTAETFGIHRYSKPGLNNLDEKLARYLNFRNGFFIECGANDGFRQSNTYYLERFYNWSGLLVEPVPELHVRCKKLRQRSICIQCALVGPEHSGREIGIHYAGLMSVSEGAFHDEKRALQHVEEGLRLQGLQSRKLKVPAVMLSDLLDQLQISHPIDFLSLDVEGSEEEVLQGIDFLRHRPRYILVEARHLEAVETLLEEHYKMVEQLTHHDFLFAARRG